MVLAAPHLALRLMGRARTGRTSVRIMWLGVVSCQVSGAYFSEAALNLMWDLIVSVPHHCLSFYFNIKVSIKLPVATRHYRDMTENLLKATLNPNKQQLLSEMTRSSCLSEQHGAGWKRACFEKKKNESNFFQWKTVNSQFLYKNHNIFYLSINVNENCIIQWPLTYFDEYKIKLQQVRL